MDEELAAMIDKMEPKMSDEEKQFALREIEHYLMMDCYDFALDLPNGWQVRAGALAVDPEIDEEDE